MQTFEGRKINPNSPLSEYPTPQFRRDSYFNLNGEWDFEIQGKNGELRHKGKIIVPYAVETEASGVKMKVGPEDTLVYSRRFRIPEGFRQKRVLLHFEAVDQIADVCLNSVPIAHHEGGYLPFTVDMLELLPGENLIEVRVKDDTASPLYPRGKQANNPNTIWYTATSGIWGSVWLESVPKEVIQSLTIVPDFDHGEVEIEAKFEGKMLSSQVIVSRQGKEVARSELNSEFKTRIALPNVIPWTPTLPALYDVEVRINEDKVQSYFGMRKFSVMEKDGHEVFALNNEPLFLSGVLDQGYFPESGLTPPTDQAMIEDIQRMKDMGFNMLRKHIKIEPMRWYYHCDRLGMIVIQDMVNGGAPYKPLLIALAPFFNFHFGDMPNYGRLGRASKQGRDFFESEMKGTVERLKNVVSIGIWTLFNEGWGQFDSVRLTTVLRNLDPTRLIDSTSGWFDQKAGDFSSHHVYFKKIRLKPTENRILSLSEFGGYSWRVDGHTYGAKNFAYGSAKDQKALEAKLEKLYKKQVIPAKNLGLSVAVLTQLSDVENETNGLLTYDRKVTKVDPRFMKRINKELIG